MTRQRPASQQGTPATTQMPRKVFNCIVDDTALVAGVKKSTRNGLRQWIKNGQIRLFVPLHALEQLSRQKGAANVRESLEWLDNATTNFPDNVTLQGGEETFLQWSDVEKFTVPRSLFSEHDHFEDQTAKTADSVEDLKGSTSSLATNSERSHSPGSLDSSSPPTSPAKAPVSPANDDLAEETASQLSLSDGVPKRLQPLFNYILWRIHQEIDPVAALESFIFLCNDPEKANLAKGFEVRCKRLEQLRDAVGREDREFRNRRLVQDRENQNAVASSISSGETSPKSPPTAPAAMLNVQRNLIDPNAFERKAVTENARGGTIPSSPRGSRGRGRGSNMTNISSRGALPSKRGRGGTSGGSQLDIDPNTFERGRGGFTGRSGRKLWVPS